MTELLGFFKVFSLLSGPDGSLTQMRVIARNQGIVTACCAGTTILFENKQKTPNSTPKSPPKIPLLHDEKSEKEIKQLSAKLRLQVKITVIHLIPETKDCERKQALNSSEGL